MALFREIQEYIALNANNIVSISGNIFLYPPQGHPILYDYEFGNTNYCDCLTFTVSLELVPPSTLYQSGPK